MVDLKSYASVTAAYWAFTVTDGALRMLVLLHFHALGYTPFDIALLFLLYEFFGIVTNAVGGWLAARTGLRATLFAGLGIQIAALVMLSLLRPEWPTAASVAYVMAAQALSGIAKDLTKMSSKSAVKLVAGDGGEGRLFRWVAVLTGSKNALKGVGFLVGGLLLAAVGFRWSLLGMAAALGVVLTVAVAALPAGLARTKDKAQFRQIFSNSRAINILSFARMFLFGARDVWFVVGVPLYLQAVLGWGHPQVGGFMAAWVIGYGFVQALAPRLFRRFDSVAAGARAATVWGVVLALVPAAMALGLGAGVEPRALILGGLALFGIVFAVNSAVHSYLILGYAEAEQVSMKVGFYYMANAAGRLAGTLLSGLLYQTGGITACLAASAAMLAVAAAGAAALPRHVTAPASAAAS